MILGVEDFTISDQIQIFEVREREKEVATSVKIPIASLLWGRD